MGRIFLMPGCTYPTTSLDLAFSDSVRSHFYFAWGCFRNFWVRSAMYRARDTRLSMLGAAAKRFNFKPSCSRLRAGAVKWEQRPTGHTRRWVEASWSSSIDPEQAQAALGRRELRKHPASLDVVDEIELVPGELRRVPSTRRQRRMATAATPVLDDALLFC
jgi:hypothetical protein